MDGDVKKARHIVTVCDGVEYSMKTMSRKVDSYLHHSNEKLKYLRRLFFKWRLHLLSV